MENDSIDQATKKQVSEKVLANLAKAQAANKLKHERNRSAREAEKEALKRQRKIDKLKKQLVELLPDPEPEEEKDESIVEEEMPQEPIVVKKIKAPPPMEKAPTTHYAPPKPVKERVKPAPPPPPKPRVDYF